MDSSLEKLKKLKQNHINPMALQAPAPSKSLEVPTRELWMARECALKCSVELAKAWIEFHKGTIHPDITAQDLAKEKQEEYYKSFIETITGDTEIPF